MKFLQKMKQKKADNKGFSLVELIIVIAIMAILVGIVGTQVVPYINRSREAKDLQLLNSYSTAAVTAYSANADKLKISSGTLIVTVDNTAPTAFTGSKSTGEADDQKILGYDIAELAGYDKVSEVKDKMASEDGKNISKIVITYNYTDKTVTVVAYKTEVSGGASTDSQILDTVVSYL